LPAEDLAVVDAVVVGPVGEETLLLQLRAGLRLRLVLEPRDAQRIAAQRLLGAARDVGEKHVELDARAHALALREQAADLAEDRPPVHDRDLEGAIAALQPHLERGARIVRSQRLDLAGVERHPQPVERQRALRGAAAEHHQRDDREQEEQQEDPAGAARRLLLRVRLGLAVHVGHQLPVRSAARKAAATSSTIRSETDWKIWS
jgi:hypothetical protein